MDEVYWLFVAVFLVVVGEHGADDVVDLCVEFFGDAVFGGHAFSD